MRPLQSIWAFSVLIQTIKNNMIQWDCRVNETLNKCFAINNSSDVNDECGKENSTCSFTRMSFGSDSNLPIFVFSSTDNIYWQCPDIKKNLSTSCFLKWSYIFQKSDSVNQTLDFSRMLPINSLGNFNLSNENAISTQTESVCTWVQCSDHLCLNSLPIGSEINVPMNNSVIIQIKMSNTSIYSNANYALFFQQVFYMGNFPSRYIGPSINTTDNSTLIMTLDFSGQPQNGYLSIWGTYGYNNTTFLTTNKSYSRYQVVSLIKINLIPNNPLNITTVASLIGSTVLALIGFFIMACLMPLLFQQKDQVLTYAPHTVEQIESIQEQAVEDFIQFKTAGQQ